jgi:glutamine synthetase
MILPATVRHLAELRAAGADELVEETQGLLDELVTAIKGLEELNAREGALDSLEHAKFMRDQIIPAMDDVRAVADRLERIVADDLWPLPKYSEMLFIK